MNEGKKVGKEGWKRRKEGRKVRGEGRKEGREGAGTEEKSNNPITSGGESD